MWTDGHGGAHFGHLGRVLLQSNLRHFMVPIPALPSSSFPVTTKSLKGEKAQALRVVLQGTSSYDYDKQILSTSIKFLIFDGGSGTSMPHAMRVGRGRRVGR